MKLCSSFPQSWGTTALPRSLRSSRTSSRRTGTVDSVDEWGKRRLAYEINKETEGYYALINFTSPASFTAELDRVYKITDGVLRSLIVKKDA